MHAHWMTIFGSILIVVGCDAAGTSSVDDKISRQAASADEQSGSGTGDASQDANARFSFRVDDGRLRVHSRTDDDEPVLVRSIAFNESQFDQEAEALQLRRERASHDAWRHATERPRLRPPKSDAERHDALLETAERLEAAYESDREHLGILRDLTMTYARLLAFEGRTSPGSNLCVLGSRRLAEFETAARPSDSADLKWATKIRACLHFQMHQYPKALELDDDVAFAALRAIGQHRFLALRPYRDGRREIQPYRTLGDASGSKLSWDELHYLVSYDDDHAPHALRVFCLVRHGEGIGVRWYLEAHFLNRSSPVRLYGKSRPDEATVLNDVRGHLRQEFEPAP